MPASNQNKWTNAMFKLSNCISLKVCMLSSWNDFKAKFQEKLLFLWDDKISEDYLIKFSSIEESTAVLSIKDTDYQEPQLSYHRKRSQWVDFIHTAAVFLCKTTNSWFQGDLNAIEIWFFCISRPTCTWSPRCKEVVLARLMAAGHARLNTFPVAWLQF